MRQVFSNTTPVAIAVDAPDEISSPLTVTGVAGQLQRLSVTLTAFHTYTSDLRMSLVAPDGREVLLVSRRGGSGDDFIETTFDDAAGATIATARPPFTGSFQPEETLTRLNGLDPNGDWTLRVADVADQDGGLLSNWTLALTSAEASPSQFAIQVQFGDGLTSRQQAVFAAAAARWSEIIVGDLPEVVVEGTVVDDVLIEARGVAIDGASGILGQAGPTLLREDSQLPALGIMEFDIGDLAQLEASGGLLNVIVHEMGHVLGIGTLWQVKNLLVGAGSPNPTFIGMNAMREFATLTGAAAPTPVPVANTGGQGTRDGHWREDVFGSELMTGFLNPAVNPLSRLTIASLEDLGYVVNYDAADPYGLPTALELAVMGIGADSLGRWQCAMCGQTTPGCVDASMLSPGRFFGGGLKERSHRSDSSAIAHS
ncbi:MAG: proprotein convertase P-domain-containing protein [Leptolyngbyaceae cyanobacterium]